MNHLEIAFLVLVDQFEIGPVTSSGISIAGYLEQHQVFVGYCRAVLRCTEDSESIYYLRDLPVHRHCRLDGNFPCGHHFGKFLIDKPGMWGVGQGIGSCFDRVDRHLLVRDVYNRSNIAFVEIRNDFPHEVFGQYFDEGSGSVTA